jgi:TonB family protein
MRYALLAAMSLLPAVVAAQPTNNGSGPKKRDAVYAFYAAKPDYPYIARINHMEGSGVFLVDIRADGRVQSVETVQSTGHPELDRSTITAFQKWRFQVNQPTQVKIPIIFLMGQVRTHDPIPVH